MAKEAGGQLSTVMQETRVFPPPQEFAARAAIGSPAAYEKLWNEAAADVEEFWGRLADELHWFKPFNKVLDWNEPYAQWFVGGQTNVSYNCLDAHLGTCGENKAALIWEGEPGDTRTLTYQKLHREVCKFANVLKKLGVGKGDVVSIYMPMVPELAIAMLACARIGAVHSVIFGGFSAEAIADRNNDAEAKLQITADGGWRRGQELPLKENVDDALAKSPTVENCIVLKRTGNPMSHAGRPRLVVARLDGRRRRPIAPPSRSTAKLRCSSSTPADRPASPRASSTPRPVTTCSRKRRSSGSSTIATRTSSGARPTSAGSPGTATSSTVRWRPGPPTLMYEGAPELARRRAASGR